MRSHQDSARGVGSKRLFDANRLALAAYRGQNMVVCHVQGATPSDCRRCAAVVTFHSLPLELAAGAEGVDVVTGNIHRPVSSDSWRALDDASGVRFPLLGTVRS